MRFSPSMRFTLYNVGCCCALWSLTFPSPRRSSNSLHHEARRKRTRGEEADKAGWKDEEDEEDEDDEEDEEDEEDEDEEDEDDDDEE